MAHVHPVIFVATRDLSKLHPHGHMRLAGSTSSPASRAGNQWQRRRYIPVLPIQKLLTAVRHCDITLQFEFFVHK